MTSNEVAYWQLQEQIRSNKANEQVKAREADTHQYQAREQARSNIEKELETHRSNVANEQIKQGELVVKQGTLESTRFANTEQKRHNLESEQIQRDAIVEKYIGDLGGATIKGLFSMVPKIS